MLGNTAVEEGGPVEPVEKLTEMIRLAVVYPLLASKAQEFDMGSKFNRELG